MRSTEGLYFSRLDHVRALAAYLVFCWHFLHLTPAFPVPYASAPMFPFALVDEGHTGVALFMTLSGYLFAKLVGDRGIDFPAFLWSRTVRLGPLLAVVIAAWVVIGWLTGAPIPFSDITQGFILPTWPKGTWSVSIELHFYLLFPILLLLFRKQGPFALLTVVAIAILIRFDWWRSYGEAQHIAYWTIIGRIDQFTFGMIFALVPLSPRVRTLVAAISGAAFLALWQTFDRGGGYYNWTGAPSPSPLWIVIPTVEAITYASIIAWYDNAQFRMPARIDRALAKIGEWSFSIYLLHFFPAVALRNYFWTGDGTANNFYLALIGANVAFFCFLPVAALSYNYFEKRFLVWRRPYLRAPAAGAVATP
ncbi:MAG TPA: acyltransferase [Pseudolabrys sp.]|nr:acyltransferase [Pseudolabrys sp.]